MPNNRLALLPSGVSAPSGKSWIRHCLGFLFLRAAVDWDPTDSTKYTCDGNPDWDQEKTNVDKLKAALEEKLSNGECKEDYPIAINDTQHCYWLKEQIKVIHFFR